MANAPKATTTITSPPPPPGQGDGVDAFFARHGLSPAPSCEACHALARSLFPSCAISEARPQGYCSYTLCVDGGPDATTMVLQFRPPAHRLDVAIADAARDVYGALAPRTRLLAVLEPPIDVAAAGSSLSSRRSGRGCEGGLDATDCGGGRPRDEGVVLSPEEEVEEEDDECRSRLDVMLMTRLPGISLAELRASTTCTPSTMSTQQQQQQRRHRRQQREALVRQFAGFIATGWGARARPSTDPTVVGPEPGRRRRRGIGGSIGWRLEQMSARLPGRFRPEARRILQGLGDIVALPWVLTHGDIVPANVMVGARPESSSDLSGDVVLTGLLDWAEAEYLPFGVGLYGLEELLGDADDDGSFRYYPDEQELREIFWERLEAELPDVEIGPGSRLRKVVEDAHTLGFLLWHGIAFDDGRLDRVVEEGRDGMEIRRLDLFFASKGAHSDDVSERVDVGEGFPETADLVRRFEFGQAVLGIWKHIRRLSVGHTTFGNL